MEAGDGRKPVEAVVVGGGSRGWAYARYASLFPDKFRVVAVADPRAHVRRKFQEAHSLPASRCYSDWTEAAAQPKMADSVVIATPDALHAGPAVRFAGLGYHVLLEKPMATTEEDCRAIAAACRAGGVMLAVGHVLRYYPQTRRVRQLIDDGALGRVCHLQLVEHIGFWHFAHSFVRGNWRSEAESTFALMAKSCHDLDLIKYWMSPSKCAKVSSFGTLQHFRHEEKPDGAGVRCLECSVEPRCPYSAKKLYLDSGNRDFPVNVVVADPPEPPAIEEALRSGPYGRCVYECDNDVVSNQVVNMEFSGGRTAAFTMVAFTEAVCDRQLAVYGSKGQLSGSLFGPLTLFDFAARKRTTYAPEFAEDIPQSLRGHGGADFLLISSFVRAIAEDDPSLISTGPEDALESHLLVFAAEKARRENRVVDMGEDCPKSLRVDGQD